MSVLQQANSQIENILTKLNVDFKRSGKWLTSRCAAHGGDNRGAMAFCTHTNKWVCFTRHCQEEYGNDVVGLVSGILQLSRNEAYGWLSENIQEVEGVVKKDVQEREDRIYEEHLLKKLLRTDFYLKRGFSQSTVDAFEHGKAESKTMRNRIVFPIRDEKGFIRGFSGRWAGREVQKDGKTVCLTDHNKEVVKWRHTSFKKSNYLYRLNEAKSFSKDNLIIVESIGNVMRFYDAGFKNCVASLGSFLSLTQAALIMKSTKKAVLAFDNDKAGIKAEATARKILEPFVNLKTIFPPIGLDWADLQNADLIDIWNKNK